MPSVVVALLQTALLSWRSMEALHVEINGRIVRVLDRADESRRAFVIVEKAAQTWASLPRGRPSRVREAPRSMRS